MIRQILVFSFFISMISYSQDNKNLFCKVQNGSFVVINHEGKTLNKFIENSNENSYKCSKDIAAALIGNYFVTSDGNSIQSRKLFGEMDYSESNLIIGDSVVATVNESSLIVSNGSQFSIRKFDNKYNNPKFIHLKAKGNRLGGMIGQIFFISDGLTIKRRTFKEFSKDSFPLVQANQDIIGVYWQNYLIASDFENLIHRELENFDGDSKTASANNLFSVIHGNHFYVSNGDEIKRKYFSNLKLDNTKIDGSEDLIGAYIFPYFIAVDSKRFQINVKQAEESGDLVVRKGRAIYLTDKYIYTYDVFTGQFTKKPTP